MKLTEGAFEAIYLACDPMERRPFFTEVRIADPSGAVVIVSPPVTKIEAMMTGRPQASVRLMAIANGVWDVLPELKRPAPRGPGGVQYA